MQQSYNGLKVVDLSRVIAGPYATMILADLGAEIIKIEAEKGDDSRHLPPKWDGEGTVFLAMNRNKKSVVLDLKSDAGREAVLRLIETADVFVEGFRPGVADRLGLGFDVVAGRNPNVIYCSISAFGNGPLGKDVPGYDALLQAFSGILRSTGHPGEPPARIGPSAIDLTTGMWSAIQIMAALARREHVEGPQRLEATLVDSSLNLMCHQLISVLATGLAPQPQGSGAPSVAPYEIFKVLDGEMMVAAGNDELFRKLCDALELEKLVTDPAYSTVSARVANRTSLHDTLEVRLVTQSLEDWQKQLSSAGVPVCPVQDLKQAVEHPLVVERGIVKQCPTQTSPELKLLSLPLGDLAGPFRAPPKLGEHTDEILRSIGMAGDRD